jgi:hypothetical protein
MRNKSGRPGRNAGDVASRNSENLSVFVPARSAKQCQGVTSFTIPSKTICANQPSSWTDFAELPRASAACSRLNPRPSRNFTRLSTESNLSGSSRDVAIAETSSTSAGARPHVKRPRGQSLDGALDAVDAAAQGVELTIRLQTLPSGQIFAQSANLLVLVPLVNPSVAPSYLVTELVRHLKGNTVMKQVTVITSSRNPTE